MSIGSRICGPNLDQPVPVQIEGNDGGAADQGQSYQNRTVHRPAEMLVPLVFPWMEETLDAAGRGVLSGAAVPLATVAGKANEREVSQ